MSSYVNHESMEKGNRAKPVRAVRIFSPNGLLIMHMWSPCQVEQYMPARKKVNRIIVLGCGYGMETSPHRSLAMYFLTMLGEYFMPKRNISLVMAASLVMS